MSAFIVSDNHIHAVVAAAAHFDAYLPNLKLRDIDDRQKLGQILVDANYESVNYRYKAKYEPPVYRIRFTTPPDPIQAIKAIDCLDYQSCEVPDWESTEAFKILERIKSAAIAHLPGYQEAKWSID